LTHTTILTRPEHSTRSRQGRARLLVAAPLVAAGLLWAYWPALREMVGRWSSDPRYSHGYLVPAFAVYLLWARRGLLAREPARPNGLGVALIGAGAALRVAGAYFYVSWFDAVSLLPALAGFAVLLGGWQALRWAWPALGFLIFMIPLPYRLEVALGAPLQRMATLASNYALQTLGLPSVAEGNIIRMGDASIGVVEACNGLGMLFMFLAFSTGAVMVIRRPLLDKALILASAAPIALAANVTRITTTGLLHHVAGGQVADAVFHDLAGWLMMPLALAALWAELSLLSHLFREVDVTPVGVIASGMIPGAGVFPAPNLVLLRDDPPARPARNG